MEGEVHIKDTIIGINLPWWNGSYCHDLGYNHMYPHWPVTFDEHLVESTFSYLKFLDIRVIRFWLFEGGEGLIINENGAIIDLDETYRKNLTKFVELASKHQLMVYYTLFDANSILRNNDFITESIIAKTTNTIAFCNRIVPKVLKIVHSTTWAIDLCNEPESIVAGENGNYSTTGYNWLVIMNNLKSIFYSIKQYNPQIKISIGSGFQEERNIMKGMYDDIGFELDFFDFHSHRTDGYVPKNLSIAKGNKKDIIIGELSACENLIKMPSLIEWRCNQNLIWEKLHAIKNEKFVVIFLWRLNPFSQKYYNEDADSLMFKGEKSKILTNISSVKSYLSSDEKKIL